MKRDDSKNPLVEEIVRLKLDGVTNTSRFRKIESLLASKADVNERFRYQSLLCCCMFKPSVLKLLLTHKADVNAKNLVNNMTPLHVACGSNDLQSVDLLIAAKADANATCTRNKLPIDYALRSRSLPILECLHKHRVEIPLHKIPNAILHSDTSLLHLMLQVNPSHCSTTMLSCLFSSETYLPDLIDAINPKFVEWDNFFLVTHFTFVEERLIYFSERTHRPYDYSPSMVHHNFSISFFEKYVNIDSLYRVEIEATVNRASVEFVRWVLNNKKTTLSLLDWCQAAIKLDRPEILDILLEQLDVNTIKYCADLVMKNDAIKCGELLFVQKHVPAVTTSWPLGDAQIANRWVPLLLRANNSTWDVSTFHRALPVLSCDSLQFMLQKKASMNEVWMTKNAWDIVLDKEFKGQPDVVNFVLSLYSEQPAWLQTQPQNEMLQERLNSAVSKNNLMEVLNILQIEGIEPDESCICFLISKDALPKFLKQRKGYRLEEQSFILQRLLTQAVQWAASESFSYLVHRLGRALMLCAVTMQHVKSSGSFEILKCFVLNGGAICTTYDAWFLACVNLIARQIVRDSLPGNFPLVDFLLEFNGKDWTTGN